MEEIFQIQLQKENDTALYQQLAEGIMNLITDGYLPANSKLPPIRKMAQHFGVNSVTIVSAYKYLESKQMVYSRVGSGTFVSPLPVEHIPEPVANRNIRSYGGEISMENAINFSGTSLPHEMFPVDDNASDLKKNNIIQFKDVFWRAYNMPDIAKFEDSAWKAVNAMSDVVTHSAPQRNTATYNEKRWGKIMDGHVMFDQFVNLVNKRIAA